MTLAWSKNKKGAALTYAIMVLLLLATVVIALTALSTTSYSDAVLTASDDQSYYYAKSIGLAVKEQFKDGYNIARIITKLDELEDQHEKDKTTYPDPKITGTFRIQGANPQLVGGDEEIVNGTVQIRYARNDDTTVNKHVIEVRSSCIVNNSLAIVTSIFSCEDDSDEAVEQLSDALTDYDVILTNTERLSFDFTQASESGTGNSNLSVYVYAGEDDNVTNPEFKLYVNMAGKLTTTGKTTIASRDPANDAFAMHFITGDLASYGDLSLLYTSVQGAKGVHVDGNFTIGAMSFISYDAFVRGSVTLATPGRFLHPYGVNAAGLYADAATAASVLGITDYLYQVRSVYAHGDVTLNPFSMVGGDIYTHGDVRLYGGNGYHIGNTCVGGNIYCDGNVYLSDGALVGGNIIAKGTVYVDTGATVVGYVQSITGSVYVRGAIVGGQVNAPLGTISLTNKGYEAAAQWVSQKDLGTGTILYGGIGLFNSLGINTCAKFNTGDSEYMSLVRGSLYVDGPTTYDYTPFYSVWCQCTVFLRNSTARFVNSNGNRTWFGANEYGNPYTYIKELYQNADMIGTETSPWIDMAGAHVEKIIVGESNTKLRDAYIYNGWINNVIARCLFICDMRIDAGSVIYAKQYMHIYGSGAARPDVKYNRLAGLYPYASDGITRIPQGVTIHIACTSVVGYEGTFKEETRYGLTMGINSEVYALIYVGSATSSTTNSYVILGDESLPGSTKFYGVMYAYVGNFKITANARLSTAKSAASSYVAAAIYAEVTGGGNPNYDNTVVRPDAAKNSFYVEKKGSGDAGEYRYGSFVEVKGSVYVAGWLHHLYHVKRDDSSSFTNTNDARIKGDFVTDGQNVSLQGTSCFTDVHCSNTSAVVKLNSALTVNSLRVNGTLNINGKKLIVKGDMFVVTLQSNNMGNTEVKGHLTIGAVANGAALTASTQLKVGGDLWLGAGNVDFTSSSCSVAGVIEAVAGNVSVSGGASVGSVKANTLTVGSNGYVKGNFNVTDLVISGGVIAADSSSTRISGRASTYTHKSGSVRLADITVVSAATNAINITGGTGYSVELKAPNGGASVTGGSSVDYTAGNLYAKKAILVAGGFQCGISSPADVNIGTDSDTTEYNVGAGITSGDYSSSGYRVIYSGKSLTWKGKAKSTFTEPPERQGGMRLTAVKTIKVGTESSPAKGYFDGIYSKEANVEAYVEKVDGVYAYTSAKVYVSTYLGYSGAATATGSGIKTITGDAHVKGLSGSAILRGHNEIAGDFYFDGSIDTTARIKCAHIYGLDKVKQHSGALWLSLYLTGYSDYTLTYSLAKDSTWQSTGAFSIQGNLSYNSPVRVEGQLYVNGIFTYNGSQESLVSLGGLYCLNSKVTINSDFRGDIHLPNVTEITLNAAIGGLNAPSVKRFTMNHNVEGSLSLTSCEALTIGSGKSIGGSVEISPSGVLTNNGTIGASASTGTYTGSGSVGKDLILNKANGSSTITGVVRGKIWSAGSITINSSQTFGGSNAYIYAKKNITITNARFNSATQYILTDGGDITMTDCVGYVPKVWNMYGFIYFSNHEGKRAEIASVLSYGTYVKFGTGTNTNYQTVTGALEWNGSYSGEKAIEFHGSSTNVNGTTKLYGTGNIVFENAQLSVVTIASSGTVTSGSGSSMSRLNLNHSTSRGVTSATIRSTITGDVVLYGTSDGDFLFKGSIGDTSSDSFHAHGAGGGTLTIEGKITGSVEIFSFEEATLKGEVVGSVTVSNCDYVKTEKKISGNLRAHDCDDMYIEGNIGGSFTHTAPTPSSASAMNVVRLGRRDSVIEIGGRISAHGRVVDNSKQTVAGSEIYVKGAYYVDFKKSLTNTSNFYFTTECGGSAIFIGDPYDTWTVNTNLNIAGRLIVYTFYRPSKNKYYTLTFNGSVTTNALYVNTNAPSGTSYQSEIPSHILQTPENGTETLEHFDTYNVADGRIWKSASVRASSTSKQLVLFTKPVFVSGANGYEGTCYAANTKFAPGCVLSTGGQTCFTSCCFYSMGWQDNEVHCYYSYDATFGISVRGSQDGSMFVHALAYGGNNYFKDITTNSNVSVYYGQTIISGDSELKGCLVTTSFGYMGHTATKLFYFGDSVKLSGTSRIKTTNDRDVDLPAGRTIVWVNKGTLVVEANCYIGYCLYQAGSKNDALNRNSLSFNPGIFVSDMGGGRVDIEGTSYVRGSIYVYGCVTTDIMAYAEIDVCKGGVVCEKDKTSNAYHAGLYGTEGAIWTQKSNGSWNEGKSNPDGGGWFGYWSDSKGGRKWWSTQDRTPKQLYPQYETQSFYIPYGAGYVATVNNKWTAGEGWNLYCYTPWPYPPDWYNATIMPVGIAANSSVANNITRSAVASTENIQLTMTARQSAPSKPEIKAEGTIYDPTSGNATVSPVIVSNVNEPDRSIYLANVNPSIAATFVSSAAVPSTFPSEIKAVDYGAFSITYELKVSYVHPSSLWTTSITNHFDKTHTEYWNTRYVPYVWKLPYTTNDGESTPAKRVLKGKSFEKNGEFTLADAHTDSYYVNADNYTGSKLAGFASSIKSYRMSDISGNKLWDYIAFNGYDPSYWFSPDDVKRRSKLFIFESGELPYEAFYMNTSDDRTGWNKNGMVFVGGAYYLVVNDNSNTDGRFKRIGDNNQIGWKMGSAAVSYYDISWVFYTCADPANPYTSEAKDLHVVLPQGIGVQFLYDSHNTVTVVGNGRVFLYFTSGDTIYFKADAYKSGSSGLFGIGSTKPKAVYARPVGGLKKRSDGKYEPLLYMIGAGTGIDLIIEDMPLSAFVYFPFGISDSLYSESGSLKSYNTFKSLANGEKFSSLYSTSANKTTTPVRRNQLTLVWNNDPSQVGNPRILNSTIVTDNFFYFSLRSSDNLNFANKNVVPNLSPTTIYDYSTTTNSMRGKKTYSLSEFLTTAPGYSTTLLNWDYKGIRVDG